MSLPSLIRGTGGQGNRGSDSCASADAERDIDAEFVAWWEAYPRKRGKGAAFRAFKKAIRSATVDALVAAVEEQTPLLMKNGVDFCPYPATWLNAERWLDEPDDDDDADEHPYAHLPAPKDWDAIRAEAEASRGGAS